MAKLGKVVYLTEAQKETLFSEGTVTVDGTTVTYSANDLYLTPTDSKVNKSGDTMTGPLTVTQTSSSYRGQGGLKVKLGENGTYPRISFFNKNDKVIAELSITHTGNSMGQVDIIEYGQENTSDMEYYFLPAPTVALGEGRKDYNILTSKNAVTVAQGGTGATTAEDARINLGIGNAPVNIYQLASGGNKAVVTMKGNGCSLGIVRYANRSAMLLFDSYSNRAYVIGQLINTVVIQKNEESKEITIQNNSTTSITLIATGATIAAGTGTTTITENVTRVNFAPQIPVSITNGGTGATTAANALTNLGAVAKSGDTITGTLNLESNLIKIHDYGSSATSIVYVDTTESVHRNVFTTSSANVFGFRQYNKAETSPALAAGTYYEGYLLPSVSTGLTGNQSYNIITDKPGEQFVYKAGDTFSATAGTAANRPMWYGAITSDSKTIYLCARTDKSLASISSIAVTTLTGWIYGVSGAADSSTTSTNWVSNYTVTAAKSADYMVKILIKKRDSTAFSNVTASSPVVANANLVLTFS